MLLSLLEHIFVQLTGWREGEGEGGGGGGGGGGGREATLDMVCRNSGLQFTDTDNEVVQCAS